MVVASAGWEITTWAGWAVAGEAAARRAQTARQAERIDRQSTTGRVRLAMGRTAYPQWLLPRRFVGSILKLQSLLGRARNDQPTSHAWRLS